MTLYTLVLPSNLLHQKIIIKLPNFNSYNTVIILQIAASFSIVSSIQFYHTRARSRVRTRITTPSTFPACLYFNFAFSVNFKMLPMIQENLKKFTNAQLNPDSLAP